MTENRVVLITGASTGIGRSIAEHLAKHHFTVFGTSRTPEAMNPPSNWNLVQLDVRSDESVEHCIKDILNHTGHLDVLINNAGYGLDGALEEATLDQVKSQFETNYFGAIRTIKTVLPAMRAQLGGYIINISAGNASIRLPFMGHYTATKCALEGFSEILRQEVRPFGIHVSVVEPSFIKSNIAETIQMGKDTIEEYEPWKTRWIDVLKTGVRDGADPMIIARSIMQIVGSKKPRFMYLSGPGIRLAIWVHRWLPENLSQWIFQTLMRVTSSKAHGS